MADSPIPFRRPGNDELPAPDLVRECGRRLTDRGLWNAFQKRFQRRIFLYLMRALGGRSQVQDLGTVVPDLAQEVYLRLVQADGHLLRSFRGETEFSVMAFLARISNNVATDYLRHEARGKRRAQIIPIDKARSAESNDAAVAEFDASSLSSILSWIDVERIVESEPDRKNARRNALIFKLHYVDGLTSSEISRFPGFELSRSGVEAILARLRKRIQNEPNS